MINIPQYALDGLGGEFVRTQELERVLAEFLGVKHCVMVTSGTAALFLALRATGAKKVAIPALTMIATATAAELAGCEISFVANNELPNDIDTYLHVSLNGRDNGIEEVLRAYPQITVIEDACQSLGSSYNGKYLGTFGKAGCFSFSPHKILTAGNGGCVVTNDDDVARNVKKLKNFGREAGGADYHESIGYNFKFTDIQADFVLKQFANIEYLLQRKRDIYQRYYAQLSRFMRPHSGTPWFVDIYVDQRDQLHTHLLNNGIGTRKMYPLITTQPPFACYQIRGSHEQDKAYSERGLWLPSSTTITDTEIDTVIEVILAYQPS